MPNHKKWQQLFSETKFMHYINFLELRALGTTEKILEQRQMTDCMDKGFIEINITWTCHDPFFRA